MDNPLYPEDGVEYEYAMAAAIEEYEAWLTGRKLNNGIRVYSRKELEKDS